MAITCQVVQLGQTQLCGDAHKREREREKDTFAVESGDYRTVARRGREKTLEKCMECVLVASDN